MVHRGQLLPGVEDFLACRNRPPHTTRTGEVLSRLSVEDAASAGWINLALNGLDLLGDIKVSAIEVGDDLVGNALHPLQDRKSTRLNSSHVAISYAVFCLKKKKI